MYRSHSTILLTDLYLQQTCRSTDMLSPPKVFVTILTMVLKRGLDCCFNASATVLSPVCFLSTIDTVYMKYSCKPAKSTRMHQENKYAMHLKVSTTLRYLLMKYFLKEQDL